MAFAIGEVGIERDTTQVLFAAPPIIEDRHMEGGPAVSYELSIANTPCVVNYVVEQDKAKLKIRMEQLTWAQVLVLDTLMNTSGPVTVKLTPGSATTITCAFAPRSEHSIEAYNGPHPESDKVGDPLTPILTTYKVTLSLLRL